VVSLSELTKFSKTFDYIYISFF